MTKQERVEYKKRVSQAKEKRRTLGINSLTDFEIIELLLMFSLTTTDATVVAHELFNKYGSLVGILEAQPIDLLKLNQMNEQAACLLHMIMPLHSAYNKSKNEKPKDLRITENAVEFLKPKFFDASKERIYLVCMDEKFKVLSCDIISEGEYNRVNIDQAKLLSLVALSEATYVIMAHNHPHGFADPSPEDDMVTVNYINLLKQIDVTVFNHIIFSDTDYFSYRDNEWYEHMFE